MKHTPGKWTTENPTLTEITVHSEEMDICTVLCIDIEPKEAEANAKLIAAAPEMLAQLKYLLEVLKITGCTEEDDAIIETKQLIKKITE